MLRNRSHNGEFKLRQTLELIGTEPKSLEAVMRFLRLFPFNLRMPPRDEREGHTGTTRNLRHCAKQVYVSIYRLRHQNLPSDQRTASDDGRILHDGLGRPCVGKRVPVETLDLGLFVVTAGVMCERYSVAPNGLGSGWRWAARDLDPSYGQGRKYRVLRALLEEELRSGFDSSGKSRS